MEKIPFVDYVYQRISRGEFVSASTTCNYLVYGTVTGGQRDEYLNAADIFNNKHDPDDFMLRIEPSLFGSKRKTILSRRTGYRSFTRLTVTAEQATKLYEAWKIAAEIQTQRNNEADEKWKKQHDALHWWP